MEHKGLILKSVIQLDRKVISTSYSGVPLPPSFGLGARFDFYLNQSKDENVAPNKPVEVSFEHERELIVESAKYGIQRRGGTDV